MIRKTGKPIKKRKRQLFCFKVIAAYGLLVTALASSMLALCLECSWKHIMGDEAVKKARKPMVELLILKDVRNL